MLCHSVCHLCSKEPSYLPAPQGLHRSTPAVSRAPLTCSFPSPQTDCLAAQNIQSPVFSLMLPPGQSPSPASSPWTGGCSPPLGWNHPPPPLPAWGCEAPRRVSSILLYSSLDSHCSAHLLKGKWCHSRSPVPPPLPRLLLATFNLCFDPDSPKA